MKIEKKEKRKIPSRISFLASWHNFLFVVSFEADFLASWHHFLFVVSFEIELPQLKKKNK